MCIYIYKIYRVESKHRELWFQNLFIFLKLHHHINKHRNCKSCKRTYDSISYKSTHVYMHVHIYYILHSSCHMGICIIYTHRHIWSTPASSHISRDICVTIREVVVTCYTGAFLTPIPLVSVNLRAIIEPTDYPRIQMRVRRLIQGWLHRTWFYRTPGP